MTSRQYKAWTDAAFDAWALSLEASAVVGLRMARMASGGQRASDEMSLMVSEKMQSAAELQARALTGGLGVTPLEQVRSVVRHYRGKVAANRRRLS